MKADSRACRHWQLPPRLTTPSIQPQLTFDVRGHVVTPRPSRRWAAVYKLKGEETLSEGFQTSPPGAHSQQW